MNRLTIVLCLSALLLAGAPVSAQPIDPAHDAAIDPRGEALSMGVPPERYTRLPWVEGVSREQRQQANRIFQEGNALIREGLFAVAAEKYERALALWDHPGFRYNLAIAQINLDQSIEAYESFRHAIRFGAEPLGQDRHEQAQSYLTLLGNQLARIALACDEPGTIVTLDGKPAFAAPGRKTIVVLPGGHQVMASKPARLPDTRQVVLAPGQHLEVTLTPQVPEYVATWRRWPRSGPFAITGIGLVTIAAGGILDWQSASMLHDFDRNSLDRCPFGGCPAGGLADALRAQHDQAIRLQRIARATYVTGAALFTAGAVLSYLNESHLVRRRVVLETAQMSIFPVLTPGTAGVSAHFQF
jgi:tetratricopeptide (TPR) repeat protein